MPTEKPTSVTTVPILDPPMLLSANRTEQGIFLQWWPPETPSSPLTGYVLQARRDQGQWVILSGNISANQSELLVKGLLRVRIQTRCDLIWILILCDDSTIQFGLVICLSLRTTVMI